MLLRQPTKILIDSLSASTVVPITGGVTVEGYGDILLADILNAYCQCPSACVKQQTVVCVSIPDSCECPYEWPLLIKSLPCLTSYEVQQTFGSSKYYGYQNPSGATPTANETATAVTSNINADPNATVTATVGTFVAGVFTPNTAGTCILLEEKNCQLTCGFQAFTDAGTVTTITAHVDAVLSNQDIAKLFPIQWGFVGSRPSLGFCGEYCVYHFKIRKSCDVQDISQANAFNCYEEEVYFYVKNTDPAYTTYWYTEMQAAFPTYLTGCAQDSQ